MFSLFKDTNLYSLFYYFSPLRYRGYLKSVLVKDLSIPHSQGYGCFGLSHRFEIWQAHQQLCCWGACRISERSRYFEYKSRGFESLRDLTTRHHIGYWNRVLVTQVTSSSPVMAWIKLSRNMMTSSNGNIFRVTGPLCGAFTGFRWIPPAQRPVTWSFDVFFDPRLYDGWVNNRKTGDLRRHRAHYDVAVKIFRFSTRMVNKPIQIQIRSISPPKKKHSQ